MKIIWRKKEFIEFITLRGWALMRRRVNEIPANLQPIGFGFSLVEEIRQGFWKDENGIIYVGFLPGGGSNFHYFSVVNGGMRSEASWPEPALEPVSFEEGYYQLKTQLTSACTGR